MNSAIIIRFLTPYISSITRDQDFVHSPLPLDGALAHAVYWESLVSGRVVDTPTSAQANPAVMNEHVLPVLDAIFAQVSLRDLLQENSLVEQVYAISSGFPLVEDKLYLKRGAHWLDPDTGNPLQVDYEMQPIRKRVPLERISALDLALVGERGSLLSGELETGKGVLKAVDNRVTTWQVYDYVWLAHVLDRSRLESLLKVLQYQGMGKKRTAGFGRVLKCEVKPLGEAFPRLEIDANRLFVKWHGDLVLLRPLPYDAIMSAPRKVVMTNLIVESGCGYRPPYWSDRRVVVREGTIFRFLQP